MPRRVLIVDDHPSFRASARRLLEDAGFDVVAQAGTVADALAAARDLRPDVILLDINLPDGDGYQVASGLDGEEPPAAVVLVSTYEREDFAPPDPAGNIAGFVSKYELSGEAVVSLLS